MVDVISQFLTSGSKLTDAIELFGTDFELANISIAAHCGSLRSGDLSRVPLL